jgi:hypothetical protein
MELLHEVCREASASAAKDYSPASIGRRSQARRGPSLNTLYSPKGSHFRKLIDAWSFWDGVDAKKPAVPVPDLKEDNELLERISDLVVRSYVGMILAERRSLRSEVNILKKLSQGNPVIDLRPKAGMNSVELLEPLAVLAEDERETLANATNETWLKTHHLGEGIRGELIDRDGKIILPRGALPAIRKLLGGRPVGST